MKLGVHINKIDTKMRYMFCLLKLIKKPLKNQRFHIFNISAFLRSYEKASRYLEVLHLYNNIKKVEIIIFAKIFNYENI